MLTLSFLPVMPALTHKLAIFFAKYLKIYDLLIIIQGRKIGDRWHVIIILCNKSINKQQIH